MRLLKIAGRARHVDPFQPIEIIINIQLREISASTIYHTTSLLDEKSVMTSTLPLPITPSTRSDSLTSLASLTQTVDDLLERYLNLLHQYQTLQTQLSQSLSSVCFPSFNLHPFKNPPQCDEKSGRMKEIEI